MAKNVVIKCVYELHNKDGTISYRVQIPDEDPKTPGKRKLYGKTFPGLPLRSGKKEKEAYAQELLVRYRIEVRKEIEEAKRNINCVPMDQDVLFRDYANIWLKDIERCKSHSYYERGKESINKVDKYFGHIKIKDITISHIQKAIDDICRTEISQPNAKIRNQSVRVIDEAISTVKGLCKKTGLSRTCILSVRKGEQIKLVTAQKICDALHISVNKHFNVINENMYYSKNTVKGFFRVIRTILGQAAKSGIMLRNPAYGQSVITISAKEKHGNKVSRDKVFDYKEYKQFEGILIENIEKVMKQYYSKQPQKDYYDIRQSVMFLIGLHTGLRNGELCGLRWVDIDFTNNKLSVEKNVTYTRTHKLHVGEPKSQSSKRSMSISPLLVEVLKLYKLWWDRENEVCKVKEPYLFLRNNGELINPSTPLGWLKKLLRNSGIKHINMHGLRHTHATISIVHYKMSVKIVSQRLGHHDAAFTMSVYTHFLPEEDQALAEMWDDQYELSVA